MYRVHAVGTKQAGYWASGPPGGWVSLGKSLSFFLASDFDFTLVLTLVGGGMEAMFLQVSIIHLLCC